jgi:hypothetical protein
LPPDLEHSRREANHSRRQANHLPRVANIPSRAVKRSPRFVNVPASSLEHSSGSVEHSPSGVERSRRPADRPRCGVIVSQIGVNVPDPNRNERRSSLNVRGEEPNVRPTGADLPLARASGPHRSCHLRGAPARRRVGWRDRFLALRSQRGLRLFLGWTIHTRSRARIWDRWAASNRSMPARSCSSIHPFALLVFVAGHGVHDCNAMHRATQRGYSR